MFYNCYLYSVVQLELQILGLLTQSSQCIIIRAASVLNAHMLLLREN